MSSPDDLASRIRQADAWFRHGLSASDEGALLRTAELRPAGERPFEAPIPRRRDLVEELCRKRLRLLHDAGRDIPDPPPAGRLLLYDPDLNLFCGAAEQETEGFFDVDNVPPWDLWLDYVIEREPQAGFDAYLVSWIPAAWVERVAPGIRANPERCIGWADELKRTRFRGL